MTRYRITISGSNKAAMASLIRRDDIEVSDHGISYASDVGYTVTAFAASEAIRELQREGYRVIQHEDADELAKDRLHAAGADYLKVDQVEAALASAAAAPYANIATLIALPHLTHEGRQCHALKIAGQSGANRVGVYFLGGVHANEWGSPDILINFIQQLERAYVGGDGLTFGGKTFSAADISKIVDTLDILVFPQANPDGRYYSMNVEENWRKNRRPAPAGSPNCCGVDLNRNYDFLWDFRRYFSPDSTVATCTNPCSTFYCGPSSFSEPESRNARWIVEQFANTRFFIDLHSAGQHILYRWSDDSNQSTNASMNFMNTVYDGKRGTNGPYMEYIPKGDLATSLSLAGILREAIKAVRGTDYDMAQGYRLYPMSGSSEDYFYSRHCTDATHEKIITFTLEWGKASHPRFPEMQHIIDETTAGLLAFCLEIATRYPARMA